MKAKTRLLWLLLTVFLGRGTAGAAGSCEVCGGPLGLTVYAWEDKVARVQKLVCERCATLPTICYVCGVPVSRDITQLPDGRVLCARDLRSVVLDEDEAKQVCRETADAADWQFSRFLTFPRANVRLELMDRLHLLEMFKVAGNDLQCPNVWGCTTRFTNETQVGYQISLLSGLPRDLLKATSVHEYTHVWLHEHLSPARWATISPDAVEGFCELLAYLALQAQHETGVLEVIRSNHYTRGQILLFISAEAQFGLNDVVDWMLHGEDDRLQEGKLGRIRRIVGASRNETGVSLVPLPQATAPPPAPDKLTLQGVFWQPVRPVVVINGRSFEVQERGSVRLGQTNVTVQCLAIRPDSVRIRVVDTGEESELKLKNN